MIKRIKTREFNNYLNSCHAKFKSFPGATIKELHHYVIPTLENDTPDVILIHGGCNDVKPMPGHKELSYQEIAEEILNMGLTCREKGVNNVVISGLICRKNKILSKKIWSINNILRVKCQELGFYFVNNQNITERNLWKDGLHLNHTGTIILANNFLNVFNSNSNLF